MARAITLIGAGRMGSAMARGWVAGGDVALSIVDPAPGGAVRDWAGEVGAALNPDPAPADVIVIAVKPQVFPAAIPNITPWIGETTLILSVMAGVTLARLEATLGTNRIIRAMPNTPGAIGQGVSVVAPGSGAHEEDYQTAVDLLSPLGLVEGPLDEAGLVKATAVSGCGPAYVFLLAELMAEAGVARGLDPDLSARIARATVEGAAALMAQSEEDPAALRQAVTSPGGVTKAALDVLMADDAAPSMFERAFKAAETRDAELSSE
ncbi:MAG: pyrroline-5-carboxylate reductase [Pseudomonadota bacterium]